MIGSTRPVKESRENCKQVNPTLTNLGLQTRLGENIFDLLMVLLQLIGVNEIHHKQSEVTTIPFSAARCLPQRCKLYT